MTAQCLFAPNHTRDILNLNQAIVFARGYLKSGDLNAVLSDYSPDVVIVTPAGAFSPDGVFVGSEIRKLFTILTAKDNLPGGDGAWPQS